MPNLHLFRDSFGRDEGSAWLFLRLPGESSKRAKSLLNSYLHVFDGKHCRRTTVDDAGLAHFIYLDICIYIWL
jgi:hypothetical protein